MKPVHLIGIGGSGLSAIARVLLESGVEVSGSDRSSSPLLQELADLGARVFTGHQAANIAGAGLVVRSSAVPDSNPEVAAALAAGIPVLKRSDFIGQLTAGHLCIAVAGTHGKTTTTAMLAWMLTRLQLDPSYIIGGASHNLGNNAHAGRGEYFVIEADEYDRMFLGLRPNLAVITYLEHDHPDCYPTFGEYQLAFEQFAARVQPGGLLLAGQDQPATRALIDARHSQGRALSFGMQPQADYRASDLTVNPAGGFTFNAWLPGAQTPVQVALRVPGEHNVRNALAALAVAHQLGLDLNAAAQALNEFSGTGRRFELLGERAGVAVISDYAHHPTEIRATLAAARARYASRRIWAVWQPHTYSRTQALQESFAQAFADADQVLVTEIYAAREPLQAFSAAQVVARMPHPHARFSAGLNETAELLLQELRPGDVVIVLSAGDAESICRQVFAQLEKKV